MRTARLSLVPGFRKGAAFAAVRIEHLADDVDCVVVELDLRLRWASEDAFMERANFWAVAPYTAKRILRGNTFRMVPIFRHPREMAAIDCAIELRQGRNWFARIASHFTAGDWRLCCLHR
jgi:hypothetical protein